MASSHGVGVLVPREVRAGMGTGRTRAAEGHGRRPIGYTRNRPDPISGFREQWRRSGWGRFA